MRSALRRMSAEDELSFPTHFRYQLQCCHVEVYLALLLDAADVQFQDLLVSMYR